MVDFLKYGLQEGGTFYTWTEVNDRFWEGLDLGYPIDLDNYRGTVVVDESMVPVDIDLSNLQPRL